MPCFLNNTSSTYRFAQENEHTSKNAIWSMVLNSLNGGPQKKHARSCAFLSSSIEYGRVFTFRVRFATPESIGFGIWSDGLVKYSWSRAMNTASTAGSIFDSLRVSLSHTSSSPSFASVLLLSTFSSSDFPIASSSGFLLLMASFHWLLYLIQARRVAHIRCRCYSRNTNR